MQSATVARKLEQYAFGGLLGVLIATVCARLLGLGITLTPPIIFVLITLGTWVGILAAHITASASDSILESLSSLADAFRAFCVRLVLGLLACAALLGVLTALTGSTDVLGRLAITTLVTAVTALLLWPSLVLIDRDRPWRVGVLATTVVLVSYAVTAPAAWIGGEPAEQLWLIALVVLLTLPVGLVALRITHFRGNEFTGAVATGVYLLSTCVFLACLWSSGWRAMEKWLQTGWILLGFGALVVATLLRRSVETGDAKSTKINSGRLMIVRWVGTAPACLAATLLWATTWFDSRVERELLFACVSAAIVIAHANLCCLLPLKPGIRIWRLITIVSAIITALASNATVWGVTSDFEFARRIALAGGILASTGTVAIVILARFTKPREKFASGGLESLVQMRCPGCGRKQHVPLGRSVCERCHTVVDLRVEWPALRSQTPLKAGALASANNASDKGPSKQEPVVQDPWTSDPLAPE